MKLTSLQKALLGVATFFRSFYVLVVICGIIGFMWNRADGAAESVSTWFWTLFVFHGFTMLLGAALQPTYVKLARSNPQLTQAQRDYWAKAVLFSSVLSMPAYYLTHVLPGSAPGAPRSRRPPSGPACSPHTHNKESELQ